MSAFRCPVCDGALGAPLYESPPRRSLDSLGRVLPMTTRVHGCPSCGHVTTEPIPDLAAYYAEGYGIGLNGDDDDQVYEIVGGRTVFRTEHQADVIARLGLLAEGDRVLDFGCAKASTFRQALPRLPRVDLHLFDVSRDYQRFWDALAPADRQAVDRIPPHWQASFDLVTSFFSLEHIAALRDAVRAIAGLLRTGGRLYALVPDTFSNPGDFLVVDHVNHFTVPSLERLMADAGLRVEWIRDDLHRGALVLLARRAAEVPVRAAAGAPVDLTRARELAGFWQRLRGRIAALEAQAGPSTAIYGAGFYGSFIFSCLQRPEAVTCFVDGNPHLQGRVHLGLPVVAPADCPADASALWIGLNPVHARRIMAGVDLGGATPRPLHLAEEV